MSRDFTLDKYGELLGAILTAGYGVYSVQQFLSQEGPSPWVVLRHDVDRREGRALAMAAVEKNLGVRATYYFRVGRGLARAEVVRGVKALGHEVGYHYEILSKAKGDLEKASQIFGREIAFLRKMAGVRTAAMHGDPLSRWNNLAFWETHRPEEFELLGEAYLSFRCLPRTIYLTDTGRSWNSADNLQDRFSPGGPAMPGPFTSTDELMGALQKRLYPQVYLLVHPNRWTAGAGAWCLQWGEDACANWLKRRLKKFSGTRKRKDETPAR